MRIKLFYIDGQSELFIMQFLKRLQKYNNTSKSIIFIGGQYKINLHRRVRYIFLFSKIIQSIHQQLFLLKKFQVQYYGVMIKKDRG